MRQAIVIGAGPCASLDFLTPYRSAHDEIVCADGGLQTALRAGLRPQCYTGDNDSGGERRADMACLVLPTEKNLTDLEAAVEQALARGAKRILLCGCTGGRLDHHQANLGLLEQLTEREISALILDEENEIRVLRPGTYRFCNQPRYHYFSVLPVDRVLEGLTIQGAKYDLPATDICRGSTRTVSNEFLPRQDVTISIAGGIAYFIRSQPELV